jgi:hypothetical protein
MTMPSTAPAPDQVAEPDDTSEATVILTDGLVLVILFGPAYVRTMWKNLILSNVDPGTEVQVVERAGARGLFPFVKEGTR